LETSPESIDMAYQEAAVSAMAPNTAFQPRRQQSLKYLFLLDIASR
jgi:hypothetical protein